MKNTFKSLLITGLLTAAVFTTAPKAFAACDQLYGGTQNCTTTYTFTIEKLVQVPGKGGGSFVDNLSVNDAKYAPGQTVNFQIKVTNTSSQTIPTITLKDIFPQYMNYTAGSGTFDKNQNTLTLTINNLNAGETRTYNVSGQVVDTNALPDDQGTICLINKATGTDNNNAVNVSTSQFCVEKAVLGSSFPVYTTKGGLTTTPATGPEMLPLLGLIPGGLGGLLLRRKTGNK